MKDCWIFVKNDLEKANVLENWMFSDIFNNDLNIYQVTEDSKDRLSAFLARRKLQRITKGALNFLLTSRYKLSDAIRKHASSCRYLYVVFLNTSFATVRYPVQVLDYYKKKWPNVRYILYYLDTIVRDVALYANYLRQNNVFDLVYTFDPHDAQEYHLIFWNTPYSKLEEYQIQPKRDLYFVGVDTDRSSQLQAVLDSCAAHNISVQMDILQRQPNSSYANHAEFVRLRNLDNILPYDEALMYSLEARCILEIVRPNQAGLTLRPYEAVVYNRKLLSNNKQILSFPFYNSAYMRYFKSCEDIDWDWVKEDISVDYRYDGAFSPILLLEDIVSRMTKQPEK